MIFVDSDVPMYLVGAAHPNKAAARQLLEFAVEQRDVEGAKDLLQGWPGLSVRDAIHVALMERNDVMRILSFDAGFDQVPGIRRLA